MKVTAEFLRADEGARAEPLPELSGIQDNLGCYVPRQCSMITFSVMAII